MFEYRNSDKVLGLGAWILLSATVGAASVPVTLSSSGELKLEENVRLTLEFGRENWNYRSIPSVDYDFLLNPATNRVVGTLENGAGAPRDGSYEVRCEPQADGSLDYVFSATSDRTQKPAAFGLMVYLPDDGMEGATWTFDGGQSGTLPRASGPRFSASGTTRRFTLSLPFAKKTFAFSFAAPAGVSLSNYDFKRHHGWGLGFTFGHSGTFAKGETRTMRVNVSTPDGALALKEGGAFRVEPDDLWVPLDYCKDIDAGSALDFSAFGLLDAPAGKYGWTKNVGGHFEFEGRPGRPQRFAGMNICGSSLFPPTHADADRLAERFVRLGYNTFRIHTFEWKLLGRTMDTLELDPDAMDRLDYLYSALTERGCYATVDLFVCRCQPYLWRRDVGIDRDGEMSRENYKLLVRVCDSAFENWARFAKNFMTHANPYTGKRYADDPALPFVVFVNEERFGWNESGLRIPEVRTAYRKWLAARRATDPKAFSDAPEDCADARLDSPALAAFKAETDRAFVRRAGDYLRSIGVKALFSAFNCSDREAALMAARGELGYVDTHAYVDHPRYAGRGYPHVIDRTVPPDDQATYERMAFLRLADKPFAVSEWNWGTTSQYRGAGGLSFGAFAARQDWNVLWRFTYSDSGDWWRPGDEGGYPSFTCSYDPMMTASERAVTCLFLRGDMAPLESRIALEVTPAADLTPDGKRARTVVPAWHDAAHDLRVATVLPGVKADGWRRFDLADWGATNVAPVAAKSDGAYSRDLRSHAFSVVTPRTSGGFAFPDRTMTCGALAFRNRGFPATVWASALVGDRLETASRILVTHLTDTQRQGSVFLDDTQKTIVRPGKGGILMRDGQSEISLALANPGAYRVFALRSDGRRLGPVPARAEKGRLTFTAAVRSPDGARYLYEATAK